MRNSEEALAPEVNRSEQLLEEIRDSLKKGWLLSYLRKLIQSWFVWLLSLNE
jgi:hypothetical protein